MEKNDQCGVTSINEVVTCGNLGKRNYNSLRNLLKNNKCLKDMKWLKLDLKNIKCFKFYKVPSNELSKSA